MLKFTDFLQQNIQQNLNEHYHYPLYDFGENDARHSLFTPSNREKFIKIATSKIHTYLKKDFKDDENKLNEYLDKIITTLDVYISVTGSIPSINVSMFQVTAGDVDQDVPAIYNISSKTQTQLENLPLQIAIKMGILPNGFAKNLSGTNDPERIEIAQRLIAKHNFDFKGYYNVQGVIIWLITSIAFNMEALNSKQLLDEYMKNCMMHIKVKNINAFYKDFFDEMKKYYKFK